MQDHLTEDDEKLNKLVKRGLLLDRLQFVMRILIVIVLVYASFLNFDLDRNFRSAVLISAAAFQVYIISKNYPIKK